MVKKVLEGLSILPTPPKNTTKLKEPLVYLDEGLLLSDDVYEMPTLILGPTGSGKSYLLERMMEPILEHATQHRDNVFIFCAKKDYIRKFKRPQDTVISVDATAPNACWNIFAELRASNNPDLTARDISKCLTSDSKSQLQPFFEQAANHIFYTSIMAMYEDEIASGEKYSNRHLYDFFQKISLNGEGELTWNDLAKTRPERFGTLMDYFTNPLEASSVISEIKTLLHDCFWGSFCNEYGEFSSIETLKSSSGKRVFLYYDHANSSQACIKMYKTILALLFKCVANEENQCKNYVCLDEFSLIPETEQLIDAMSLARSAGFRLIACLQSAELMRRHYSEERAQALLSLFPNLICFRIQDSFSRRIFADRYGQCLCSYSFYTADKPVHHTEHRPVVADYDFSMIHHKGDALMSLPALSSSPFWYHGFRKELEN